MGDGTGPYPVSKRVGYHPMVLHKYLCVVVGSQSSPMGIGVEHYGVVLGVYLVGGWYWGIPSF